MDGLRGALAGLACRSCGQDCGGTCGSIASRFDGSRVREAFSGLACRSCGQDCGGTCGSIASRILPGSAPQFASGSACDNSCFVEDCFEPAFYLSVFGGYTQLDDFGPFSDILASGLLFDRFTFDDGFGFGLSVGQIQGQNLRTEFEFAFRDNNFDERFSFTGFDGNPSTASFEGSVQTYSGMFNLLWDFKPRPIFGRFRPYAGAGIGFAIFNLDEPLGDDVSNLLTLDDQSAFAYQLIGGVSRPVSFRADAYVEYRHFSADSLVVNTLIGTAETDYQTDNVFFGLRFFY